MKRTLSVILCLLLLLAIAPIRSASADVVKMTPVIDGNVVRWSYVSGTSRYCLHYKNGGDPDGGNVYLSSDTFSYDLAKQNQAFSSRTLKVCIEALNSSDITIGKSDWVNMDYVNPYYLITEAWVEVTEPVVGQRPDHTAQVATDNGNFTAVDVKWYDVTTMYRVSFDESSGFLKDHRYEVEVEITLDDDTYLSADCDGVDETATVNDYSTCMRSGASYQNILVSFRFPLAIDSVSIKLDVPAAGKKPDYTAELPADALYYSNNYNSGPLRNDIFWSDSTASKTMIPDEDVFVPEHVYIVTMYLTAKDGAKFIDGTTAKINGDPASVKCISPRQILINYTFTQVPADLEYVYIYLDPPTAGMTPDYEAEVPAGARYYSGDYTAGFFKNDIFWKDETTSETMTPDVSVFEVGHVYSVSVYMTPIARHRFSDSVVGMVNNYDAESINRPDLNQAYFSVTFPEVPPDLTSAQMLINPPIAGEYPDFTPWLPPEACYYSDTSATSGSFMNDVYWHDVAADLYLRPDVDMFAEGRTYKVTIWLTPKIGYRFADVITGTINGSNVEAESRRNLNQARFTCTFTALPPLPKITKQPQSVTATVGETVTFSIAAEHVETYQWQVYMDETWNDVHDDPFTGSQTNTLQFKAPDGWNGLQFRCLTSNGTGSTVTDTVVLTLKAKPAFDGTIEWNSADVQYKGTTPYVIANGKAQKPRFTVKDKDGNTVDPSYYTYAYKENTNAGTGYVFVTFKVKYAGTASQFFKIYLPATTETKVANVKDGVRITWKAVEGAAGYVIYRRAWNLKDAGWTTFERWNNTTALEWTDTTVYAGTRYQYGIKAYFAKRTDPVSGAEIGGNVGDNFNLGMVGPLKTMVRITTRKLSSVKAGTKKMTVKWSGSKVFTGYEIQYATNSKFTTNVKKVKITDPATVSKVIKSLKSGKKYYVRVRSYHVFEGMTYYGQWSGSKSCTVK